MDKKPINWNTIIGMTLIGAILIGFNYFNTPEEVVADESSAAPDSVGVVEETAQLMENDTTIAFSEDSLAAPQQAVGPFVNQNLENTERITIENEVLELEFSKKGAQLISARLKNFQTWDSLPLYLVNESASHNIALKSGGATYNTAELIFSVQSTKSNAVSFQLNTLDGGSLTYSYSLDPKNYMLNWNLQSEGSIAAMVDDNAEMVWEMVTLPHEKNRSAEAEKTNIEYYETEDEDLESLSVNGSDEEVVNKTKWVGFKQQFFSTILLNKATDFENARLFSNALEESDDYTKRFLARVGMPANGENLNANLGVYLGPNKYEVLEAYGEKFEQLIPLGWGILGWINRGVIINIFNWLEGYGLNYGLIILIIALLIKLVIFPLTYTSYRSMAKMRVLKPEIDQLNEKYKDKDAMQKQQATMELYRKAGVNPLGGCIPVLLQMPILIALFNFFPSSIELRQQSFLWASDLSTYDSVLDLPFTIPFYGDHVSLFTLLMTVSTLIYTYMNQQLTGQNQQYPQMKYIVYLMPVVFLGVFNNYAAGLSYYYFLANMITFGQQFAIRAYLDEDKIRAKMQEKKKAPVKENRFMRRMRELQEQQEKNRK